MAIVRVKMARVITRLPESLGVATLIACSVLLHCGVGEALPASTAKASANKIPPYLKLCHRNDPKINECIKQSIESLKPKLAKGIPELEIPPFDPFVIPELTVEDGERSAVKIKSRYTDIQVWGPSEFQLNSVDLDWDNNRIDFDLVLPSLITKSNYTMEGKILLLPITGNGKSNGNYTDVKAKATCKGERLPKNGSTYFHVRDFEIRFDIGKASVHLDNLFGGDATIGDATNVFLNENWRAVVSEIQPILEQTVASIFKDVSNKIFARFPTELLFES